MKLRLKIKPPQSSLLRGIWDFFLAPKKEIPARNEAPVAISDAQTVTPQDQDTLENLVLGFEHDGKRYISSVTKVQQFGAFTRLVTEQGGRKLTHEFIMRASELAHMARQAGTDQSEEFWNVPHVSLNKLRNLEAALEPDVEPSVRYGDETANMVFAHPGLS